MLGVRGGDGGPNLLQIPLKTLSPSEGLEWRSIST